MYDLIAHYYDLTHADLRDDLPLLHQLAQEAGNGRILECGCGTGRILIPLARAGCTLTGLDSSPMMLDIAREKLAREAPQVQAQVTLVAGDMTQVKDDGRFALIIIPYNTLLHLTPTQVSQTFTHLRQVLAANGRLYIDLINPFAIAQTPNDRMLTHESTFTDPTNHHTVLQFASNWLDDEQQTLNITWIYDATPANGGAIHRTITQFRYHYLYPHELELRLKQSGFQLQAMWGNYDCSPFTEESERLILIAQ
ncbi:MAG: class I SAM-dependent methyltransferase [Ardenticatenaceae bacterium]|nr:class I SAM-dependent methyltransferase [Ardenticatenaceae bacterium]